MFHESRVAWIALLLLGASIGAVAGVAAQSDVGPESPCIAGAKWHYRQAAHWLSHDDQAWHVGAGDALLKLNDLGESCNGWDQDATRPGMAGDGSASQADEVSQSVMVAK